VKIVEYSTIIEQSRRTELGLLLAAYLCTLCTISTI